MSEATSILDLLEGFRRSKALLAAVRLGIFDGNRPPGAAISRLMDTCVAMGLLDKRNHQYVNTEIASMYLARSSPRNLVGYIQYSNQTLYALWENLEDALIEGTNRWEQVFGTGVTVTSYMSDPARKRDFLCGMHGFGLLSSPAVVSAFDLSRFRCFVDLGGATGHLVSAALAQYPSMRGILFELPSTIELVRDLISDEIEIITGDYFRDPLPAGDLFALGRILHSQSRDKSLTLLRRVWDSLPPEGAVLVVETLLDGGKSISAHLQSLNMLLVNGGCERALSEYEELFQEAGFKNICAAITGTPLDAVIALK